MNMRLLIPCALMSLLAPLPLHAQDAGEAQQASKPILWQLTINNNTKVTVLANRIAAVAMHPFYLNGAMLISEVTIDTLGSNTIRFYYVHEDDRLSDVSDPRTALGTVKKGVTRAAGGQNSGSNIPSVKYPEGTYSHSIEYQVSSAEDLEKIYKSLLNVLRRQGIAGKEELKMSTK